MEKENTKKNRIPEEAVAENALQEERDGEMTVEKMKDVDGGMTIRPPQYAHIK